MHDIVENSVSPGPELLLASCRSALWPRRGLSLGKARRVGNRWIGVGVHWGVSGQDLWDFVSQNETNSVRWLEKASSVLMGFVGFLKPLSNSCGSELSKLPQPNRQCVIVWLLS